MLDLGRDICRDPAISGDREWLVTNGMGGYAMGTIAGLQTRSYHGLLIAALRPPVGRMLLLARLEETAAYGEREFPLYANRRRDGTVFPQGFQFLVRFHLEGAIPVWTFALADAVIEKRIWMQPSASTTYVSYRLVQASRSLALRIAALVNYRDHHTVARAHEREMGIEPVAGGLRFVAAGDAVPFHLLGRRVQFEIRCRWESDLRLTKETDRGLPDLDAHLHGADLHVTLEPGGSVTLVATTERATSLDGEAAHEERRAHESALIDRLEIRPGDDSADAERAIVQLALAADQFIVRRDLAADHRGYSVIAGYPWFADWGRDTMISLPGLTLATGRPEVAREVLRTFARFVDQGMLPNRFPDAGEPPEYNTVDATLWFFEAIRAYHAATGDDAFLRELFPILQEIIAWHRRGTRFQIRFDAGDGLLYAGEEGVQLTWMDAKVEGWVVTPRIGKPVEVNALWHHALRVLASFGRCLGEPAEEYERLADHARHGFSRFWNRAAGCCYDVLDGPDGEDPSLRPNQLLAVSLPSDLLDEPQSRAVVDVCARKLLTPCGLRSLSPEDPSFIGRYGGDRCRRDAAYHQGTVWSWWIGPFIRSHLRVYHDPARARSFLLPLLRHLQEAGIGTVSEIFDGDPPFRPCGCVAQAWGVAELLRALRETADR